MESIANGRNKSTVYFAATTFEKEEPARVMLVMHRHYVDEWVRGGEGWRIKSRELKKL